jgi:preprotein translocase subunit YajC
MNTHRTIIISLAALFLAATFAVAHGNLQHVIGTVAKVSPDSVTITTNSGKTVEVALAGDTKISKAGQSMQKTDIQVGDRVVIHAEMEEGKLSAHTIELGVAKKATH